MKKNILLIIAIIFIVIFVVLMTFFNVEKSEVGSFCLDDYTYFIENCADGRLLGPVDNEKVAKEKAEEVWLELYGKQVKEQKPYCVYFDIESETWLVKGSLQKDWLGRMTLGGTAHIILRKSDGMVLAVWHYS